MSAFCRSADTICPVGDRRFFFEEDRGTNLELCSSQLVAILNSLHA